MWEKFKPEELATPEAFQRNPKLVWEWYAWRRELVAKVLPNPGHHALVEIERRLPRFTLITQNVDSLHQRAGSRNVIELHGNISRTKCFEEDKIVNEWQESGDVPPRCPSCGGRLRPDVVWFGEMLPQGAFERAARAVRDADLLLVIGTSGVVFPAAGLVSFQRELSIEINPQLSAVSSSCTFAIAANAAEATPPIVQAVLDAGTHR